MDGEGFAYVIAVNDAASASRLETALIGILTPDGNSASTRLTWLERRYLASLRDGWSDGSLLVCDMCGCLHEQDRPLVPATEPDPACTNHHRPIERRDHDVSAGFEPFTSIIRAFGFDDLPGVRRAEDGTSEDVLEQVSAGGVPDGEDAERDLVREPFVDGA